MRYSYTEEELRVAVVTSTTYREVISKLGIIPAGGNYATVKKRIVKLGISTSHFSGKSWSKGLKRGPKRPLSDYLTNKHPIKTYRLKNRLIKEGYFEHKCNDCKYTTWLGYPIPLELHHKDGNSENNQLNNLELLCPNCHSQTSNYRGKGIR